MFFATPESFIFDCFQFFLAFAKLYINLNIVSFRRLETHSSLQFRQSMAFSEETWIYIKWANSQFFSYMVLLLPVLVHLVRSCLVGSEVVEEPF